MPDIVHEPHGNEDDFGPFRAEFERLVLVEVHSPFCLNSVRGNHFLRHDEYSRYYFYFPKVLCYFCFPSQF